MGTSADEFALRESLAHRLLDALAFDKRFDGRFERAPVLAGRPTTEVQRAAAERLAARRQVITPQLVRPPLAKYYAEQLSEDELRGLIAFFESPIGQRFVALWGSEHTQVRAVIAAASAQFQAEHRRSDL